MGDRRSIADDVSSSPSASVSPSSTSINTGVSWVVVAASSSATGAMFGRSTVIVIVACAVSVPSLTWNTNASVGRLVGAVYVSVRRRAR